MRAWRANLGAGLGGLKQVELATPEPGPGQVLVRVRAASLNYREHMIVVQGQYPLPVKKDLIPVSDGAGEAVAVGPGVERVKSGDRVVAHIFPLWLGGPFTLEKSPQLGGSLDGMLAEYVVLDEEALLPVPAHLSFEAAATLPCAGLTAWNAVTGGRGLSRGDTLLTLGSGGVSLFALQFGRMLGARVLATTSSAHKVEQLQALGADHVITAADFDVEVRRLTGGRGVNHIVEVGGPGSMARSLRSIAMQGEIAWVGDMGASPAPLDASGLRNAVATLRIIAVGNREQFEAMLRLIAETKLAPVVDRVFSFDDVHAAFTHAASGKAFGKTVIEVSK